MDKALCSLDAVEEYYKETNEFQVDFEEFRRKFSAFAQNEIKGIEELYTFYVKLKAQTEQYIATAKGLKSLSENKISSLSSAKSTIKSNCKGEEEQKAAARELANISAEINKEKANIARYSTVLNSLYNKKEAFGHKAESLATDLSEMKEMVGQCEQYLGQIQSDNIQALSSLNRVMFALKNYSSLRIE